MPISAHDIAEFLAWWRRQGRETKQFPKPRSNKDQLQPWIERVEYTRSIRVSDAGGLVVTARNIGRRAWVGGITVSFRSVPHDGDNAFVTVVRAEVSNGGRLDEVFVKNRGDDVWRHGNTLQAEHLVHEVRVRDWDSNQVLTLVLRVLPLVESSLPFLVLAWACDNDWAACQYVPDQLSTVDQQKFPAFPLAIDVTSR